MAEWVQHRDKGWVGLILGVLGEMAGSDFE